MILLVAATFTKMSQDAASTGALRYAASQPLVILKYLRLAFWPRGLVLDYTNRVSQGWAELVLPAIPLVVLFVLSLVATAKRRPLGFLGLAFFVLLAPSSSFAATLNVYNEHRMYLALATVVISVLAGLDLLLRRAIPDNRACRVAGAVVSVVLIAALATGTIVRNRDWKTELGFWIDNVEKRPHSSTAHNNLGNVLQALGRPGDAMGHYQQVLRLRPGMAKAHNNMGDALQALGRPGEAIGHYREAVRLEPDYAKAHNGWGNALLATGHAREAALRYREALRIEPDFAEAHNNCGKALEAMKQPGEAVAHYQQAVRIDPGMAKAHVNLGNILQVAGRAREALVHFRQAVQVAPDYADARNNLANALLLSGQPHDAISHYREALRIEPGHADAHYGWGVALRALGQDREANEHFEQTLRLNPNHAAARQRLREARESTVDEM